MKINLQTNPYVTMWTEPKTTLRKVLKENPKQGFIVLSFFYGLVQGLNLAQGLSFGKDLSLWMILLTVLLLAIPIGVIYFNVSAAFFYFVGKLIKGKGSFIEVRASVVWANVTQIASALISGFMVLYFQKSFFLNEFLLQPFEQTPLIFVTIFLLSQIVLSVWTFVIFVAALSEAQQISIWKSIANIILANLVVIAIIFIMGKIMMLMGADPIAFFGGII